MDIKYSLFPDLQAQVVSYLCGGNLSDLEYWVAGNLDNVLHIGTEQEQALVKFLKGSFIEISEEILTEAQFKRDLEQPEYASAWQVVDSVSLSNSKQEETEFSFSSINPTLSFTTSLAPA